MSSTDDPIDGVFRTSRVVPFRPDEVFAAFATRELLERWWGPSGFTNSFELFDFRPGGRWKFVMHGPDGSNYPNESEFVEVQPASKIVIQHRSPPHFVLTITLAESGAGTAITWTQAFEDAGLAARIRAVVVPANEQNLDRLTAVLGGASTS